MGGLGSGRSYRYDKKRTVADYVCINISTFIKHGKWLCSTGSFTLHRRGENIGGYSFEVFAESKQIKFSWYNRQSDKTTSQLIYIVERKQKISGNRYYFSCPRCEKQYSKLYGGGLFFCRNCHGLTYKSCQESHTRDGIMKFLGMTKQQFKSMERYISYQRKMEVTTDTTARRKIEKKYWKQELNELQKKHQQMIQ